MEVSEETKLAKEVIQALLKAKKTLRMYPSNNPIYVKTVDDTFRKADDLLNLQDEFKVRIKQNELLFGSDVIYQNPAKDDNLALFFFKDGLREMSFRRGLTRDEFHEFLDVLAFDYEREDLEDDVVTLLWEKDFQNIKYVVDEAVLTEDEDYEKDAVRQAKSSAPQEDDLKRAYEDASGAEDEAEATLVPITDKDLKSLVREVERDQTDKKEKFTEMLFDMLYHSESAEEAKDIVEILMSALEFTLSHGDLSGAVRILNKAREMAGTTITEDMKRHLASLSGFAGSQKLVKSVGDLFDTGALENEAVFSEYVEFLDKNAIAPFMTVLGELKSINARKMFINALIFLGNKDIVALAKGLRDDRWYVVRNIIYVLRMMADKRAVEYLTKAIKHNDVRVRKEVVKALGELGAQGVAQNIRECLDDPDSTVRAASIRALGALGSDYAKRTLFEKITDKRFKDVEFAEKKEYFEALVRWKDAEVFDFLMRTVRRSVIFGKSKNDENRACAAYALGLLGNKDALSALHKLRDSGSKFLSEYAYAAIRRIEYGR